jgi:hypothetical protein
MKNSEQTREVAESSFKKRERRLQEGRKAMAEHDAAARAVDANTARLRALRLARDAAEAVAPVKAAKVSRAKKKTATPSPPLAATIEGDKQQSPKTQSDRLKMAESDGAGAPITRTLASRDPD